MKTIGIIAEYNPFHRGHEAQLRLLRERYGSDCALVIALGGCFTQRGEAAVFAKYARAEAAVRCGADLVLEVSLPWAVSSAEGFARGGVAVLRGLGSVEALAFGSEGGDLGRLRSIAALTGDAGFDPLLREALSSGEGYARARQKALEALAGEALPELRQRNDILGVEYLRALEAQGGGMEPLILPRFGEFPPASALRQMPDFLSALPEAAAEVFRRETALGRRPEPEKLDAAILARLRSMSEEELRALPGAAEGLERRLRRAAVEAGTAEELVKLVTTKRYPAARIRRMVLAALLGIPAGLEKTLPSYLRVLGLNGRGAALLRASSPSLPVITKPAGGQGEVFELEARACGIYALSFPEPGQRRGDLDRRATPFVLK
ncbi:MAG: nucleotidyltransferase family protein [Oscillospiraceae bacterium]|nr:nucleotidyltransferase family protein [Oscillospiraceae bacterium]